MKIEMGESLFYSWLRHVKECQIVQLNWKPSTSWRLQNEEEVKRVMEILGEHFQNQYGYAIYKKNSFSQFLMQAEVDVLGISISGDEKEIYAIDVAFHENGLHYGDRQETVMRVMKKFIRTALCAIGYFGVTKGELIFASPKMPDSIYKDLEPCIKDVNSFFCNKSYNFTAQVIANDSFRDSVLKPILIASDNIADTSELFVRSYQLIKMFEIERHSSTQRELKIDKDVSSGYTSDLKVGEIAKTSLREALGSGNIDDTEIALMQTQNYSKNAFGINLPLLVLKNGTYDNVRYYATPLTIRGIEYRLCSQWIDKNKSHLLAWLKKHEK